MVIWSVQSDIFFRVLLLFCICCRWEGVGRGEYFTDDGCLIWGVGGGGGWRGLVKNVNFQECNTHGKGRRFRIVLYASLPIVRKVDSSIHWMNLYPRDSAIHLLNNRGLVNKGLLIRPKKKTFSCGPKREVPNEQDEFILPAGVANQNTFFASSCPLMNSAI